tara:strand:- start:1729 stop:2610 length:882 start_codon:yes stop_codon:yes gene_type:complete
MSDKLRNMKIAQSRIDKLRFILQIKNDKSLQVTDKTIKAIEQEITVDLYNKIIKDHQLFFIIVILSHSEYSGYIFTSNIKKTEFFDDIEKILFGRKFNNYGSNYDIKMDFETEGYNNNIHALNLIMKILIKNLEITDHMIGEILALHPFDNDSGESLLNFSVNSESDVSKKSLSNDKKYIVIRILLSIYLNEPNQSDLYERVQTIILNSDNKFIETITATAEQYTVQELEIAIGIFNEKLQQKKREASITGGKKKTKYSIFMSKELKRLKKKNPDKDYKLRFKEAVNNWKNKK